MRRWLERLLDPSVVIARKVQDAVQDTVVTPATRLAGKVESLWPPEVAILAATGLQALLPHRVGQLRWVFVGLCLLLIFALVLVNPQQIEDRHIPLRAVMLAVVAALSVSNAISGGQLVADLVNGEGISDAATLLRTGGAIWLTNVIVFSLWYWLFDRGGLYARMLYDDPYPAFMFPQMDKTELAPPQWRPQYIDYLYLSFTNAMAFSPTDTMPLKHWAKLTMLVQSLVSLMIAILVVARAVNILG
jgi:uncharacterized membrane protein